MPHELALLRLSSPLLCSHMPLEHPSQAHYKGSGQHAGKDGGQRSDPRVEPSGTYTLFDMVDEIVGVDDRLNQIDLHK